SRQKSAEVQRLERLNKAIPELAELDNLQKQLQELGEVVELPQEFPEQLRQVEQSIRETKLQRDKDRDRLHKLQGKQEGISLNQSLLDHADTIEDLLQRLGAYRDGRRDRSKLDGMRIAYRKDAGTLIEDIRPDLKLKDGDSLRPVLGKKRTIQDLSSRHEALTQQTLRARKQKDEAEKELKEITKALAILPAMRESDGLAQALKLAVRAGDIDRQIEEISRDIAAGKKGCQAELKRLGLWAGELDQLLELSLPLQETVRHFETDFSELDKKRRELIKDRKKAETELKDARAENKEVAYGGEVPTELELKGVRQKRQEGWQLLRRQWIDGEDVVQEAEKYEPGLTVHDAYEKYVAQADLIADRLRREAERVARAATLKARIETLEETIQEILLKQQEVTNHEDNLSAAWQSQWRSVQIDSLSPKEMLAWLADIDTLRFRVSETWNKEGVVKEMDKARRQYRQTLMEELKSLGKNDEFSGRELAPVLVVAESVLADIAKHKAELEKLNDKQTQVQAVLDRANDEKVAAAAARDDWQKMWDKALAGLGLKDQILTSEALDLLETIGNCFDKLEKAKELQSRINGIDRDIDKFTVDVQTLLVQTAPDLKDLSPDQAVLQLHTLLGKTRRDSEHLKKNNEEIEALTTELENAEKTLQSLDGQMAELLATAQCAKTADLAEAIRKSAEYQRLQEIISNRESSLAKVSEGVPLEDIKPQAEEVDVDELPGRIASLKRQIDEELYPRIKDISQVIGEEKKELQLMDGSTQAAEAAEKMEQVAARIRRLVEQYTRIKLAAMVLKDEIERYREEHQDPVLQIASRFFSELTLGSFIGLRTDVDDHSNPILVGIRQDNTRLTVEAMSSGSCDQLYLALRLATLEWRLETSEPMPFIVDDILINFDDDRSRATLRALADLGEKNQVILFTHHRQIVNEALELENRGAIHIHEL
ncbi:hypothetical protein ACFL6N_05405, partial [Thermodesulfobacteriota bacterium]